MDRHESLLIKSNFDSNTYLEVYIAFVFMQFPEYHRYGLDKLLNDKNNFEFRFIDTHEDLISDKDLLALTSRIFSVPEFDNLERYRIVGEICAKRENFFATFDLDENDPTIFSTFTRAMFANCSPLDAASLAFQPELVKYWNPHFTFPFNCGVFHAYTAHIFSPLHFIALYCLKLPWPFNDCAILLDTILVDDRTRNGNYLFLAESIDSYDLQSYFYVKFHDKDKVLASSQFIRMRTCSILKQSKNEGAVISFFGRIKLPTLLPKFLLNFICVDTMIRRYLINRAYAKVSYGIHIGSNKHANMNEKLLELFNIQKK